MAEEDQRGGDADHASHRHRERSPYPAGEPARHQAAERCHPHEHHSIEAHHAAAQSVRRNGLERGIGRGHLHRHAEAHRHQQQRREVEGPGESKQDQGHGVADRRGCDHPAESPHARPGRHVDGTQDGAHAHGAHQDAQRSGSSVQNAFGEHRHEDQNGIVHDARHTQQQQQRARGGVMADIVPTLLEVLKRRGVRLARRRRQAHHQQADDHAQKRAAVQQEAIAFADGGQQHAGYGRSQDAPAVVDAGVQADGVHQVLFADHLHQKGMPRGHVKDADHSQKQSQTEDLPDLHHPGQGQPGQQEGLEHRQELCHGNQLPPVDPVCHHARHGR